MDSVARTVTDPVADLDELDDAVSDALVLALAVRDIDADCVTLPENVSDTDSEPGCVAEYVTDCETDCVEDCVSETDVDCVALTLMDPLAESEAELDTVAELDEVDDAERDALVLALAVRDIDADCVTLPDNVSDADTDEVCVAEYVPDGETDCDEDCVSESDVECVALTLGDTVADTNIMHDGALKKVPISARRMKSRSREAGRTLAEENAGR